MARLLKLSTILAKVEGAEGSDSSPAAADGFFAAITPPAPVMDFHRIDVHTGAGSQLPGSPGARRWECHVEVPLRGAGVAYAAGVKPKADALLRMGGFAGAGSFVGGAEKWDYTLRSSSFESFSVYVYLNGVRTKILGARALPSFVFPLGGPARLIGEVRGLWGAPADAANVDPTGEPSLQYPVLLSSALQIGTGNYAAKHGEIRLDIGRRAAARPDGTAAAGYGGMSLLPDRAPVLTIEAEATTEAAFGWWTNQLAGTQMDCSFQVGSTQYNRVKVVIPAMQFERLEQFERDGVLMYRASCLLVAPAGGDTDLTLTFD